MNTVHYPSSFEQWNYWLNRYGKEELKQRLNDFIDKEKKGCQLLKFLPKMLEKILYATLDRCLPYLKPNGHLILNISDILGKAQGAVKKRPRLNIIDPLVTYMKKITAI